MTGIHEEYKSKPQRLGAVVSTALGFLVPLGIAALWIPIRTWLPNTELALILVLAVLAIGATGRRVAVVVSGASAAFWFELLDTRPFEDLAIQRTPDLETTLTLGVVAIVGGSLAVRIVRQRAAAKAEAQRLASLWRTAAQLAAGEELVRVIQEVALELTSLFQLRNCSFEVASPNVDRTQIERTGHLAEPSHAVESNRTPRPWESCELPVFGHQQVFGRFVLDFKPDAERPCTEDLLTAVALGDQVGAAFMAQAPYPPEEPPTPHLRIVS
jgi:K+-sensing histidine kinase KdpD